jgi:WD40 repeat protein
VLKYSRTLEYSLQREYSRTREYYSTSTTASTVVLHPCCTDGTKVVSGSEDLDQTVRIWDAVTGECKQTLKGHSEAVRSASFSPDGT